MSKFVTAFDDLASFSSQTKEPTEQSNGNSCIRSYRDVVGAAGTEQSNRYMCIRSYCDVVLGAAGSFCVPLKKNSPDRYVCRLRKSSRDRYAYQLGEISLDRYLTRLRKTSLDRYVHQLRQNSAGLLGLTNKEKLFHDYCISTGIIFNRAFRFFTVDEILRVREENFNNLLRRKKLYLLLDLDHTLVHYASKSRLKSEEKYLYTERDNLHDSLKGSLHKINEGLGMVKLRPFVHSFLKEASELFDMYICTLGQCSYAQQVAKLLDPDNVYFNNYTKLITRKDCPGLKKSLYGFLGKENAVVILDDKEGVWGRHKGNLIVAERYNYFVSRHNYRSYSVLKTDESESTGTLATALNVLRRIHNEFFNMTDPNKDLAHQDVQQVLRMIARESNRCVLTVKPT